MIEHDTIIIRPPRSDEMPEVLALRNIVLNRTVGQPDQTVPSMGDQHEDTIHVAAFDGSHIVGTARFDMYPDHADTYLVRRVATDPDYRRRGIGAGVMRLGEQLAQQQGGAQHLVLHAREEAITFYKSLGYILTGKSEVHDGNENWEMTKSVR